MSENKRNQLQKIRQQIFPKRSKLYFLTCLSILLFASQAFSQNVPLNSDAHFRFEKTVVTTPGYHITARPFFASKLERKKSDSVYTKNKLILNINNSFLVNDLYLYEKSQFKISINPIITLAAGADIKTKEIYPDTRLGFSTVGSLYSDKITFNGNLFAARTAFQNSETSNKRSFDNTPHYGSFYKKDGDLFTFLSATGAVGYSPSSNFRFELGRDKSFFGAGHRSLLLSDNAPPLPFFKTTVDVWKVKYSWMIISGNDYAVDENNLLPSSYGKNIALHHLSLNLTDRININFFEATVSSKLDSIGNKGTELTYLNPVIFYRPVEFAAGSEGNSLLGGGINIRLWKSTFLYSQFILDEFILSHVKARDGWWGNKQGVQAGFKTYNFIVKDLFALGEINTVRPFTYSHGSQNQSYGMYGDALAHPLGANFAEATAILRYNISPRFEIKAKAVLARYGSDMSDTLSYGGDIYKSYDLRPGEEPFLGNSMFQGDEMTSAFAEMKFSWLINPKWNTVFELGANYRKVSSTSINSQATFVFAGFKTQIFNEGYN